MNIGSMHIRTWQLEMLFVGSVLAAVAYCSGGSAKEWLCAVAVLLEFGESTIVDRLLENREHALIAQHRASIRKLLPYTIIRETCWIVFFVLGHSYSALVGCVVFLLYPVWRKVWRHWHPCVRRVEERARAA